MPGKNWLKGSRIANTQAVVVPSNTLDSTTELPATAVAIYVGVGGNVKVQLRGSSTACTYLGVVAGSYLEGNFKYVYSTGTTATDMILLYIV